MISIKASIPYNRAKMAFLDIKFGVLRTLRRNKLSTTGYEAGYSPETDVLPVLSRGGSSVVANEKRSICHEKGLLHPTVHLFIFNDEGQILIQKRGRKKDASAGKLSQSVGGHVSDVPVGKTIVGGRYMGKTAFKESKEEVGILPYKIELLKFFGYQSNEGKNNEFVGLYRAFYDKKINKQVGLRFSPNLTELEWAGFFSFEGILKLAKQSPHLFAPSFLKDISEYHRWEQGDLT